MGKVSLADKMRIQTLRKQDYGVKAIVAALYPLKTGSWVQWRKFASELMQQVRRLNARPAVVDRNARARSQTSNVLKTKTSGLQIYPTWTPWITMSGGNVGGLSQAPPETENDRRTEGSPAGDLGQPTSGTNRQSCQRVLKATEGLCCSWEWTFRTFTVTAMSWLCYFCLNDVILLRDCLDIFERAKIARWQHCNADNFRTL